MRKRQKQSSFKSKHIQTLTENTDSRANKGLQGRLLVRSETAHEGDRHTTTKRGFERDCADKYEEMVLENEHRSNERIDICNEYVDPKDATHTYDYGAVDISDGKKTRSENYTEPVDAYKVVTSGPKSAEEKPSMKRKWYQNDGTLTDENVYNHTTDKQTFVADNEYSAISQVPTKDPLNTYDTIASIALRDSRKQQ